MIIQKQTENDVLVEGDSQDSIGMSLDLESAGFLMQMLSKDFYSDAMGSLIREYSSNALDSHRKAFINEPIVVALKQNNEGNYEFSVEDVGVGLNDEDFKNVISKYGKSTKRESDSQIGMFGLGAKSGLAYSSSVYFICRKDGVERKYMMYEGEDGNSIDLLYESSTTERNGVKVVVPVKYSDRYEFKNKIDEQLAYFESVYFDVEGIDNNFKIIRHEDFQWSPLVDDSRLHLCLDNIYYPIDYDKLGIEEIHFPIALRFGLSDGLFPIPNRESINKK